MNSLEIEAALAARLKSLRLERGLSLAELSARSSVSRATLSRIENAEVSPTAQVLGKLCSAFSMTLSSLMMMVEQSPPALIRQAQQRVWRDQLTGFSRRSVSPPAQELGCEIIECELVAKASISYDASPIIGLEHYLLLLSGQLQVTLGAETYTLMPGDVLRYKLHSNSAFATGEQLGAKYLLVIIEP
ncbi:MAG: hypothetical protein OFPI_16240 [Osedax symbiont Rs2]|nr:MAG: hypothetical protein OFPI_16240 [Osedax symbiont Rs2]